MLSIGLVGCAKEVESEATTPEVSQDETDEPVTEDLESEDEEETSEEPESTEVARMPADGDEVAVFDTGKGRIVLMFYPDKAPNHVAQFKKLIQDGFYDGTRFHRNIEGFMIQGGDPNSKDKSKAQLWGTGGYMEDGKEVNLKAEFNDLKHARGVWSTARGGHSVDSASSQFFIMQADNSGLDGQYTAFGYCIEGMDVVDQIVKTHMPGAPNGETAPDDAVVLKKATIEKWPLK